MTSKGKANLELFKTLFPNLCTDEMSVKEYPSGYTGGSIIEINPNPKKRISRKYMFIVRKDGSWELIYE